MVIVFRIWVKGLGAKGSTSEVLPFLAQYQGC